MPARERDAGATPAFAHAANRFSGEFAGGGGSLYRASPEPKRPLPSSLAPIGEEPQDASVHAVAGIREGGQQQRYGGSHDVPEEVGSGAYGKGMRGGSNSIVAHGFVGDDIRASIKDIVSSQVLARARARARAHAARERAALALTRDINVWSFGVVNNVVAVPYATR